MARSIVEVNAYATHGEAELLGAYTELLPRHAGVFGIRSSLHPTKGEKETPALLHTL